MVYYVALPFIPIEGGLAPGEAVECPNGAAAIRRAHAMSFNEANAGAVAFSRSGDPNIGEFDDAVILKTFGKVPEDDSQQYDLSEGRAVAGVDRSRLAESSRVAGERV